ncbi:MAG: hypothetical protein JRI68_24290 [Deltaproteobacteria bacterium]|nr:hypothetical protein [Deltaproteobacteria bacterium]
MTAAPLSGQGPAKPAVDVLVAEDEAATKVLLALHRLAQQSTLYAADNEAQRRALEATASAAADYGRTTGRNITIFFSDRAVYVGRRLLRANRPVYAAANQLRNLLALMGVSQITIGFDVPVDDLRSLQEAFATAMREKRAASAPADLSRIRLRVGRPPGEFTEFDGLPEEERALKIYALAVVIVRRFFEQLQRGSFELPGHLRRIGQQLIQLAESGSPAFLATTVSRPAHDDAGRAVSSALLALSMARQLTDDPRLLRRLATATMLCDVGKPRVAGLDPTGQQRSGMRLPVVGVDQYAELPRATAVVTSALGKMTDAGMLRSVLVYEALHLSYQEEAGVAYGGARAPALLARIIAHARRFQEELTAGRAAPDVLAKLVRLAESEIDRQVLQLMMATLCVFPTGTLVELSSGQVAQVITVPQRPVDLGKPVVRLVLESDGAIAEPIYVDLSQGGDGQPPPHVVRVVAGVDDDQARAATERFDLLPDEAGGTGDAAVPKEERPTAKPGRGGSPAPAVHVPPAPKIDSLIELADRDDDIYILLGPTDEAAGPTALRSIPPPPSGPVSDLPPSALQPGLVPGVEQPSLRPRAPASAQGTLAKTPLVHLLVYVLDNKLTGTLLMVAPERGRSAIYVHGGRPCKARTPEMVSPIGETLLGMGVLDEATLTQSLQAASRLKVLHGQYLLSRGVIDEGALHAALQQQLVNKIGYMLRLAPTTRYAYFDGTDLLADYGGAALIPCEPLSLIMMGVRKYLDEEALDAALGRLGSAPLVLHPDVEPHRMGLKEAERAVVGLLEDEELTVEQVMSRAPGDQAAVKRLVYGLLITRCIDLSGQTRRPVGVGAVPERD